MDRKVKEVLSFHINKKSIMVFIVCIIINFVAREISVNFDLSIWLDTIGTCLAGCILGPIGGAICGILQNILYGIFSLSFDYIPYLFVSCMIGFAMGLIVRANRFNTWYDACVAGIVVAIVSTMSGFLLNTVMRDGYVGNTVSDIIVDHLIENEMPKVLATLYAGFIVDIPDKLISAIVVYIIYKLCLKFKIIKIKYVKC